MNYIVEVHVNDRWRNWFDDQRVVSDTQATTVAGFIAKYRQYFGYSAEQIRVRPEAYVGRLAA